MTCLVKAAVSGLYILHTKDVQRTTAKFSFSKVVLIVLSDIVYFDFAI